MQWPGVRSMTGGTQQLGRIIASLTPITTRCIPVDADRVDTCTDEEWFALMEAKYGEGFEARDFALGPANPTLDKGDM